MRSTLVCRNNRTGGEPAAAGTERQLGYPKVQEGRNDNGQRPSTGREQ